MKDSFCIHRTALDASTVRRANPLSPEPLVDVRQHHRTNGPNRTQRRADRTSRPTTYQLALPRSSNGCHFLDLETTRDHDRYLRGSCGDRYTLCSNLI